MVPRGAGLGIRPEDPVRGALLLSWPSVSEDLRRTMGGRGSLAALLAGTALRAPSPVSPTSIVDSRTDGRGGRPDCGVKLGGGIAAGRGLL